MLDRQVCTLLAKSLVADEGAKEDGRSKAKEEHQQSYGLRLGPVTVVTGNRVRQLD